MLIAKTPSADQHSISGRPFPVAFIVGVTRSGTTLLRMMLDAHPHLAIPPETHFIPDVVKACQVASNPTDCFTDTIISHQRWEDFHIDDEVFRFIVASVVPFDLGEALRAFYGLYAARFGKPRWSDKTPAYVYHMCLIQNLLPEARFIHLIRDGRDAALSIKDLSFGPNSIAEAAELWVERVRSARSQVEELRYYLEIRYEDLVLESEATLKRVCNFIDLPWDAAMLSYHVRSAQRLSELNRDLRGPTGETIVSAQERLAIHALVTKPPQVNRVERWRAEMASSDRKCYESIAAPILRDLGYEV